MGCITQKIGIEHLKKMIIFTIPLYMEVQDFDYKLTKQPEGKPQGIFSLACPGFQFSRVGKYDTYLSHY